MLNRNFSYVAFGRICATFLQAVFYILFASILGPEKFGDLSYLIAIAGTASVISRFGLNQSITVYQSKQDSSKIIPTNTLALITTSTAALILISINIYAALFSLALSFFVMNQFNQLGLKNYKKYMKITLGKNVLVLIIPILLFFPFDIPGILIGMTISNFLCCIHFLKLVRWTRPSYEFFQNNYKVLIHNFGVEASSRLPRMVDKLLIVPLLGLFVTGIYQFNMQILFSLEVLPMMLYTFLLSEESSGASHRKISWLIILLSIIISLIVIVVSPFLIEEFFPDYIEGIPSLQILVLSIIPLSITSILNAKLQAIESTRVGFSAIVRIGSLLVLLAFLGNFYGLVGLSLAVLLSTIAYSLFLTVLAIKAKVI